MATQSGLAFATFHFIGYMMDRPSNLRKGSRALLAAAGTTTMTRSNHFFSKSSYTKGLQCPKIVWMDAHMRDKFDKSLIDLNRLKAGNDIGDMAMAYFGNFIEVKQTFKFNEMAEQTTRLLEEAADIAVQGGKPFSVCEATFVGDGMVCLADIVRSRGDMTVDIIEVKSSSKVKDYHIHDLAYQVAHVERCGYDVATASIMHVNPDYVLDGELNLKELFTIVDMTREVRALSDGVIPKVRELIEYRSAKDEPKIPIGAHCNNPHVCGYQTWCWRDVPQDSVLNLAGMSSTKAFGLLAEGVSTFADALEKTKLTALQKAQAQAETSGTSVIDAEKVADFLEQLSYPVYHLDFETIQPIVPLYQGTKPWQQIPTQFSIHRVDGPHAAPKHLEFLAEHDVDPRRSIAEALCDAIPIGACTTAYNMGFEKGRIKELAELFPDLADHLQSILDNMVDLMVPFRSGWVYLPEMKGSYSIKKVLPALCPNDPQLDYGKLEGVHDGTEAMAAFEKLGELEPEQRQQVREQLLRYCELDTFAMVKVHEKLIEIANGGFVGAP